jgi:hypothetical protein
MATATHQALEGDVMVTPNKVQLEDRPDLQEIVNELLVLKLMAKDGILTNRSQHELVKHLNPKELAAVARGVALAEKRVIPCYQKPNDSNTQDVNYNREDPRQQPIFKRK